MLGIVGFYYHRAAIWAVSYHLQIFRNVTDDHGEIIGKSLNQCDG